LSHRRSRRGDAEPCDAGGSVLRPLPHPQGEVPTKEAGGQRVPLHTQRATRLSHRPKGGGTRGAKRRSRGVPPFPDAEQIEGRRGPSLSKLALQRQEPRHSRRRCRSQAVDHPETVVRTEVNADSGDITGSGKIEVNSQRTNVRGRHGERTRPMHGGGHHNNVVRDGGGVGRCSTRKCKCEPQCCEPYDHRASKCVCGGHPSPFQA